MSNVGRVERFERNEPRQIEAISKYHIPQQSGITRMQSVTKGDKRSKHMQVRRLVTYLNSPSGVKFRKEGRDSAARENRKLTSIDIGFAVVIFGNRRCVCL